MKRLSISIYNKEALGSHGPQDLFDPTRITVYLLDRDESLVAKPLPIRVSQGRYMIEIDEDILDSGHTYNVIWDYDLQAGCEQVQRYSFVYHAIPAVVEGLCRIDGNVGVIFPIANSRVEYAILKDGYSSHFEQFRDATLTDAFGDWVIFVPQNNNCQVVIPEVNDRKIFLTPTVTASAYEDLVPLQVPVTTDRFGNLV